MNRVSRRVRRWVDRLLYAGAARWCPVCERSSRRFKAGGAYDTRAEAVCVYCGALERHRLVWLFFARRTDLFDGREKKVLHVAPEACLEPRLRQRLGSGYLTADLRHPRAMIRMDITDIQFPDETFDVIYCSHVLEHVPRDRAALAEMSRVLKRGGWAVPLVPVGTEPTVEATDVTDSAERLRRFGHHDHVRSYGPDFVDRLAEAGFTVDVVRPADLGDEQDRMRFGLGPAAGEIFHCVKRQVSD